MSCMLHPRFWHARLQLVVTVGSVLAVTWLEPEALVHQIISRAGANGWFWVGLLVVLLGVALVDIVINDMMPTRIDLAVARRRRYVVYMALCGGLLSLCFVIAASEGATSVLLVYFLPACFAAHIAVTDLFHRHRSHIDASRT